VARITGGAARYFAVAAIWRGGDVEANRPMLAMAVIERAGWPASWSGEVIWSGSAWRSGRNLDEKGRRNSPYLAVRTGRLDARGDHQSQAASNSMPP